MRAVLESVGDSNRSVWLADSFAGLPNANHPQDRGYDMDTSQLPVLAVTREEVENNFRRFGLLDDRVRFIPGWFEKSLPTCDVGTLALLRVDCDLYDSTRTVLDALYSRVAPGGYVIVDDYAILPPCKQAVDDFRDDLGIEDALYPIDQHAVFWRVDSTARNP